MDFINQRVQNKATFIDHNSSATRKADILEIKNEKPLALFYRTERKSLRQNSVEQKHSNSTLPLPFFATSTDYTSTIYDLFYDENSSTIDHTLTTETYFTSTEWDNVTEITFFDKKSTSSAKPSQMPKKINKTNKTCHCDLLYKHCDIHCCCDNDCSEKDHNVFRGCKETSVGCFGTEKNVQHLCSLPACNGGSTTDLFHNLFCIDKVNLPDKRKINKNKFHTIDINKFLKWHTNDKDQPLHEFTRTEYELGHPVWLLRNETLNIIKLHYTSLYSLDNSEQYKILSAKVESTARNVTFNTDSLSVILTVDTSFIDASAPAALEYGGAPHLDIHLPKNFFFPSQSTACKVTLAKFLYLSAIVFLNK
ncbi:unnamed protein product, partial [Brenthis ino]